MTPNEYQRLAMRTCSFKPNGLDEEWDNMVDHAVFGLCAEAGEVAGLMQKSFQGHWFTDDHLKKELGDCLWMIAELCEAYGFELEDVMETNIQKLKERYPDGFDPERSLNRREGDV